TGVSKARVRQNVRSQTFVLLFTFWLHVLAGVTQSIPIEAERARALARRRPSPPSGCRNSSAMPQYSPRARAPRPPPRGRYRSSRTFRAMARRKQGVHQAALLPPTGRPARGAGQNTTPRGILGRNAPVGETPSRSSSHRTGGAVHLVEVVRAHPELAPLAAFVGRKQSDSRRPDKARSSSHPTRCAA